MKFVTLIALIAIKLVSIVFGASEANGNASNVLPIENQISEPVFSCGFIPYAADVIFTGYCTICNSLIIDNERIFAFHTLAKGNISKHLCHSPCLYKAWKKKLSLVGACPCCRKFNPNVGTDSRE